MPTTKTRINITASKNIELAIRQLAERDKMPVSTKAGELLEHALELEEDLVWADIANKRSNEKVKYIPHKTVWKSIQ